jgi:protein-L-isoaspartate(D-aspartate) O-methyltransferase
LVDRELFLGPDHITFDGKRAVPNEEVTALMLSLADLQPGEKVLEIGTGSGYQTVCIASLGVQVFSVDRELDDADCNRFTHESNGSSIEIRQGDGKQGWAEEAPFDAVLVSCGMTSIPPAYEEQLREGGRLIIPLGKPDGQELLRLEKRNGKLVMGMCAGYVRFQMCQ